MAGDSSFVVPFVLDAIAGLFCLAAFCFVRTRLPTVYAPQTIREGESNSLPLLPHGSVAWLSSVWSMSDAAFYRTAGLDALMYIKFQEVRSYVCFHVCTCVCV